MSNWRDRLRAFDDLAPDEAVYARAAQGPRHDVPDRPSCRKRLAAGVVAFAVFGAAAVLVWQAFGSSERTGPVGQSSGGMVQSGGTYRLFDLSVVFPLGQSAEASHANVSYSYEWTTEFFPGAAGCKVFLFDENGRSMGDQPFGLTSLSPSLSSGSVTVPIAEGTPATAEGSCGPGIVYEGPWDVSNIRIEGSDVRFDLAPDGVASHGSAVCAMRWTDNQGTDHIETGTATTGGKIGADLFRVPDDVPPDFVPGVRCEPYRSPDQLAQAYWLPWPDAQVTPAVPATSCFGYKVDIYAVNDGQTYEGTSGDDIVIQAEGSTYRDNGGLDVICDVHGEILSVSADSHPEFMKLGQNELKDAVRGVIDADLASPAGSIPTAEEIVAGQWPLGSELADMLSLSLVGLADGPCQAYFGVEGSGRGYCLDGLPEGGASELDVYVTGKALQGHRLTEVELATARDTLANAGNG